jgi:hypothetical protein
LTMARLDPRRASAHCIGVHQTMRREGHEGRERGVLPAGDPGARGPRDGALMVVTRRVEADSLPQADARRPAGGAVISNSNLLFEPGNTVWLSGIAPTPQGSAGPSMPDGARSFARHPSQQSYGLESIEWGDADLVAGLLTVERGSLTHRMHKRRNPNVRFLWRRRELKRTKGNLSTRSSSNKARSGLKRFRPTCPIVHLSARSVVAK